jgi:hypothetical protein
MSPSWYLLLTDTFMDNWLVGREKEYTHLLFGEETVIVAGVRASVV